jgi:hypothetical protein
MIGHRRRSIGRSSFNLSDPIMARERPLSIYSTSPIPEIPALILVPDVWIPISRYPEWYRIDRYNRQTSLEDPLEVGRVWEYIRYRDLLEDCRWEGLAGDPDQYQRDYLPLVSQLL